MMVRLRHTLRQAVFRFIERRCQRREPDLYIGGRGNPYMKRWHLIPRNKFFNVYFHDFIRDDDPRALHDHPWFSLSWLLHGHLIEHTIAAGGVHHRRVLVPGAVTFRTPWQAHRIELPWQYPAKIGHGPEPDRERAYTLFITGPVLRVWGFHCPRGWRPHTIFVDSQDRGSIGRGCD